MDGAEFQPATEYGAPPRYPIESVDNALRILLLLGERPMLRLTDVSQYLGVASSTAHRLLAMLQYRGFVRQDVPTRTYLPGPTLNGLAFGVLRQLDVRTLARPVLEKLNVEVQETVHLGRLEASDVHFIDSIESSRALRVGSRLGRSMPAHCTSNGKAMLATLTDAQLLTLYPHEELRQLTPRSVSTRTQLLDVLEGVRAQGFASSEEESEEGVSSVAVALPARRTTRLAVTASAPQSRLSESARKDILGHLFAAVEEIDRLLL
ncbi:IclR family transcriptional regulator [Knoellia sp. Soil729]|uniref:IclR family transcriptional regulator n=1 Tax=Knoellia sp. Soil729 TaxID=1736394 RepID=UPI0006F8CF70|nr:IclR family transcriptional regulator [Knoellia sp. Soil729]KRE40801.1 IclR family transcriptional regulator [Knoellia sp. Soil729]